MDLPTVADQICPNKYGRSTSYVRTNNKLIGLVFVLALSSVNIFKSLSFSQSQNHDLSTNIASAPSTSAKDQAREVEDKESSANPEQLIQDTSAKQPIAWLMTFPNSGTSYTSRLIATVTGTHTATNYGTELITQDRKKWKEGVLVDWVGDSLNRTVNSPTRGYTLTKTHCGGYCFDCLAKRMNPSAFTKACATGEQAIQNAESGKFQLVKSYTDIEKVGRAVHIIRDPFDNIVARFHCHLKKNGPSSLEKYPNKYPNTRDGFRKYCHDMGRRWRVKEEKSAAYNDLFEWIKDVPCHSDFFRYIQWHNLAFATIAELDIPSMTMNYENYSSDFNSTKNDLLQFLRQDEVNHPPSFITGKTYRHYYTKREIYAISLMFDKLAHPETRKMTQHYF